MPRTKSAAEHALALDPNLAAAHASLGSYLAFYAWSWADAEAELHRSIELDPNQPWAHALYGHILDYERRFPEAQVQWDKGIELDPVSVDNRVGGAGVALYERRYPEAITKFRKVLAMDSSYVPTAYLLGLCELEAGRTEEGIALLRRGTKLGDTPTSLAFLGY